MAEELKLSHTSAMILQALGSGYVYGFSVMEVTGLPSGTVYPAMRRLERDGLIRSQWEKESIAASELRPARKYYKLTASGKATLEASRKRYPLLAKLIARDRDPKRMSLLAVLHTPVPPSRHSSRKRLACTRWATRRMARRVAGGTLVCLARTRR